MTEDRTRGLGQKAIIPNLPVWVRGLTAAAGAVLLCTGSVAVFVTANGTGSAALLAVGTIFVVIAALAERLESFEGGGVKVHLTAVAAATSAAASTKEIEATNLVRAGQNEEANRLLDEAAALRREADAAAIAYNSLRETMPSSWERTATIENLLQRAIENVPVVEKDAVQELFESNDAGSRVVALRLMQAHPETGDVTAIVSAIREPRSSMEQYRALTAARAVVTSLPGSDKSEAIQAAAKSALDEGLLGPDPSDRVNEARKIL